MVQVVAKRERQRIAGVRCVEDVPDRQRTRASPGLGQSTAAAEGLDASVLSATAQASVRVDGEMTDLAGRSPSATPDAAVDHDAGGDARSEVQIRHGAGDPAQHRSAEGCGLHVVLHPEGHAERAFGLLGEVQGLHTEVDRVIHPPGLGVDEPRDADADGADVGEGNPLVGERRHGHHDALDDGVIAPSGGSSQSSADVTGGSTATASILVPPTSRPTRICRPERSAVSAPVIGCRCPSCRCGWR